MAEPLLLAIVGAESTGKTTLAAALATALRQVHPALRVAWVAEALREWCQRAGRTPQPHEQASILRAQHERIQAAAAAHDLVVCDTTALMTAVYSTLLFGDRSLDARALQLHRRMDFTLLTALDLPWEADGLQRDGPQVQQPVDRLLREHLIGQGLPFAVIGGSGPTRLAQALAALEPVLAAWQARPATQAAPRGLGAASGLLTRWSGECQSGNAGLGRQTGGPPRRWACECCVPEMEQTLLRALQQQARGAGKA